MLDLIDDRVEYILEPSAGKGDILDAISERYHLKDSYGRNSKSKSLYAIEIDQELVATLRGKGYTLVAYDFLTYTPSNFFDAIIMNPPFDKGAEHLLHAIEIMDKGTIVCVLNKETITNPYSQRRQQLIQQILKHKGKAIDIGKAFLDAERRTEVEAVIVHLKIESDTSSDSFQYWNEATKTANSKAESIVTETDLTSHDQVEAIVSSYDMAVHEMLEGLKHVQKSLYYSKGMVDSYFFRDSIQEIVSTLSNLDMPREAYRRAFNGFIDQFRKNAWKSIFYRLKMDRFMSRKVSKSFHTDIDTGSSIDFTVENIRGVVDNLITDVRSILRESIIDVFDHLCSFDKKNSIHIEGWKTNSAYKVNHRIILPWIIEYSKWGSWGFGYNHYNGSDVSNDLDKVLCSLTGNSIDKIESIREALQRQFEYLNKNPNSKSYVCTSTFFNIRFYKKGTVHLKWRDERVWSLFNLEVAKGKMWIGDDTEEETLYKKAVGNMLLLTV